MGIMDILVSHLLQYANYTKGRTAFSTGEDVAKFCARRSVVTQAFEENLPLMECLALLLWYVSKYKLGGYDN